MGKVHPRCFCNRKPPLGGIPKEDERLFSPRPFHFFLILIIFSFFVIFSHCLILFYLFSQLTTHIMQITGQQPLLCQGFRSQPPKKNLSMHPAACLATRGGGASLELTLGWVEAAEVWLASSNPGAAELRANDVDTVPNDPHCNPSLKRVFAPPDSEC